jgi:hypothetical protein
MITFRLVLYCGVAHFEIWPNYRAYYPGFWIFFLRTPPPPSDGIIDPWNMSRMHLSRPLYLRLKLKCLLKFFTGMTFWNNQQFNRSICLVVRGRALSNRCSHINYTGWSKSFCAPGDYNTESYLSQLTSFLPHFLAQSGCLAAARPGQGDIRLTRTPSVMPISNYVIMVSDWNFLKYFFVFCIVTIRCTETFWSPCICTGVPPYPRFTAARKKLKIKEINGL